MARSKDCWGIEVGANAIKAMRLVREGGQVRLAEFDVLPFKRVLTSPDVDVDDEIQVNLDRFMQRHDLTRSTVVVSAPGHSGFARFAKLPPVEPRKVPAIVEYEAVQQIPFPIEQVEWDYQVFQQEDSPEVEVGIFAITRDKIAAMLANYQAVGMRVDGLTLSPLAVYNALAYDRRLDAGDATGVVLLDIGSSSTDVIVVESGGIWLRTMPIGGHSFTEALMRAFKLGYAKAEKLKREAGTSKYARQIFQAMRPVFADFVQELQKSLGYYRSLNREAELTRVIGMGSTFRLPGLQKFLKQQLQMEVERLDGFERLTPPDKQEAEFAESSMNMATAYGLALQGLELESVSANILPPQVVRQRIWRAKQPWMAVAAALMLVAAGVGFINLKANEAEFERSMRAAPEIAGVQEQSVRAYVQGVLDELDSLQQDLQSKQAEDPRPRIDMLLSVADYADMWPLIFHDIDRAVQARLDEQERDLRSHEYWEQIPPEQRNRLVITGWRATYLPPEPAGVGDRSGQAAAGDFDPGREADFDAEAPVEQEAGRFEITFTGFHVPPQDATAAARIRPVEELFYELRRISAQERNAREEGSRPYRPDMDASGRISVERFDDFDGTPGAWRRLMGLGEARDAQARPRRQEDWGERRGRGDERVWEMDEGWDRNRDREAREDERPPAPLLPQWPTIDGASPDNPITVARFELTWELKVLGPRKVRENRARAGADAEGVQQVRAAQ